MDAWPGRWLNQPDAVIADDDQLVVTAVVGSDAWRHTSYGFVHDSAHALLAPLAVGQALEVEFTAEFSGQFDQAGLMIRADAEHWLKAGCEYADGTLNLGAVVTLGNSDWSTGAADEWNRRRITVRASRASESITVRAAVDRGPFRLVRVAPFVDGAAEAGPYLCAPTRAGFSVRFLARRLGPADASLH
jgi:Uncharacterized conserved protein